jgi:hypothetical protein
MVFRLQRRLDGDLALAGAQLQPAFNRDVLFLRHPESGIDDVGRLVAKLPAILRAGRLRGSGKARETHGNRKGRQDVTK